MSIKHLIEQLIELDFPAVEAIDFEPSQDGTISAMVHLADGNGAAASFDLGELRERIATSIAVAAALHRELKREDADAPRALHC